MNWDDLRVVRAVFETGSYAAAAARLNMDETTVSRRLARLQRDLGFELFEAHNNARTPTEYCEQLVAHAASMAERAEAITKLGRENPVIVRRRIAATDSVSADILAPRAPQFLIDHPDVILDFMASTENVDFSRWQADLAIRLTKPEKGDFIVTKLAAFDLFLFTPVTAKKTGDKIVCVYPEELDATPETKALTKMGLQKNARCTTKNLAVMKQLVRTHACAGVLPAYMCNDLMNDKSLVAEKLPARREAWLLVQRHLKSDAPTRSVIDWIKTCFDKVK